MLVKEGHKGSYLLWGVVQIVLGIVFAIITLPFMLNFLGIDTGIWLELTTKVQNWVGGKYIFGLIHITLVVLFIVAVISIFFRRSGASFFVKLAGAVAIFPFACKGLENGVLMAFNKDINIMSMFSVGLEYVLVAVSVVLLILGFVFQFTVSRNNENKANLYLFTKSIVWIVLLILNFVIGNILAQSNWLMALFGYKTSAYPYFLCWFFVIMGILQLISSPQLINPEDSKFSTGTQPPVQPIAYIPVQPVMVDPFTPVMPNSPALKGRRQGLEDGQEQEQTENIVQGVNGDTIVQGLSEPEQTENNFIAEPENKETEQETTPQSEVQQQDIQENQIQQENEPSKEETSVLSEEQQSQANINENKTEEIEKIVQEQQKQLEQEATTQDQNYENVANEDFSTQNIESENADAQPLEEQQPVEGDTITQGLTPPEDFEGEKTLQEIQTENADITTQQENEHKQENADETIKTKQEEIKEKATYMQDLENMLSEQKPVEENKEQEKTVDEISSVPLIKEQPKVVRKRMTKAKQPEVLEEKKEEQKQVQKAEPRAMKKAPSKKVAKSTEKPESKKVTVKSPAKKPEPKKKEAVIEESKTPATQEEKLKEIEKIMQTISSPRRTSRIRGTRRDETDDEE